MGTTQTRSDELLLHSTYYPFVMYARRRDGVALQPVVKGPGYTSQNYGEVKTVDTSAILGDGVLHVFLANRSLSDVAPVMINLVGAQLETLTSAEIVTGPNAQACNSHEQPQCISSQPFNAQIKDGKAFAQLPPLSVAALTFKL